MHCPFWFRVNKKAMEKLENFGLLFGTHLLATTNHVFTSYKIIVLTGVFTVFKIIQKPPHVTITLVKVSFILFCCFRQPFLSDTLNGTDTRFASYEQSLNKASVSSGCISLGPFNINHCNSVCCHCCTSEAVFIRETPIDIIR